MANRIYCFDNSLNQARGDTYAVFIEGASGQSELLRLRAGADEPYVEQNLDQAYLELGAGTRAAIVGVPVYYSPYQPEIASEAFACYLISSREPVNAWKYYATMNSPYIFTSKSHVNTVVCFRDLADSDAKDRWLGDHPGKERSSFYLTDFGSYLADLVGGCIY